MLSRFLKSIARPHYLYRPAQVLRRAYRQTCKQLAPGDPGAAVTVALPWGARIRVDPREHIGRSVYLHGLYDIVVSEALWRLLRPGDTAVDAGAHVGHMTSLMATRVGAGGRVLAFEPHPQLFRELERNVSRNVGRRAERPRHQPSPQAAVELFRCALSRQAGEALLRCPAGFERNRGTARLASSPGSETHAAAAASGAGEEIARADDARVVRTETLDDVLDRRRLGRAQQQQQGQRVAVLKIDVEGHEAAVLAGAARSLGEGRVTHVVYEEHRGEWRGSETHERLRQCGYTLYGLSWKRRGPQLIPDGEPLELRPGETPNFLATREAQAVERRFAPAAWRCLWPWLPVPLE